MLTPTRLRPHPCASLVVALALVLGGCASQSSRRDAPDRDGAPANPPSGLASVPDAQPRVEPIRSGGPNKPYEALGRRYVPMTQDLPFSEIGLASWYGRKFHGRPTSTGEPYDMFAMTAAHPTLPLPSYARVRNPRNGREIVVRINDRGPFHPGRIVDLSYVAALKLDLLRGVAPVELERITYADIRTGAWRRSVDAEASPSHLAAGAGTFVAAAAEFTPTVSAESVPAPVGGRVAEPMPTSAPLPLPASESPVGAAPTSDPTPGMQRDRVLAAADAPSPWPPAQRAQDRSAGFWVQIGAFRGRDGAERFRQRIADEMAWLAPALAVLADASMFRLQAGPYPDREQAMGIAERVREGLRLVPLVIERH